MKAQGIISPPFRSSTLVGCIDTGRRPWYEHPELSTKAPALLFHGAEEEAGTTWKRVKRAPREEWSPPEHVPPVGTTKWESPLGTGYFFLSDPEPGFRLLQPPMMREALLKCLEAFPLSLPGRKMPGLHRDHGRGFLNRYGGITR